MIEAYTRAHAYPQNHVHKYFTFKSIYMLITYIYFRENMLTICAYLTISKVAYILYIDTKK